MRVSCCGFCWRGCMSWPSVRRICAFFASVFCSFPCRTSFLWWSSHSRAQYPDSWPSDLTDCGRLIPATSAFDDVFVSVERKDETEFGRSVFGALFVTLIAASNFAELKMCGVFAAQWLHSAKFFGDGRHLIFAAFPCAFAGRMRHSVPSHLCIVAGFSNMYPCRYCRDEFGHWSFPSLHPISARSLPSMLSCGRREGGVLCHRRVNSSESLRWWRRYATHTMTDMLPTGICSGLLSPWNSSCTVVVSEAYDAIVRGFAFLGSVRTYASMSGKSGGHCGFFCTSESVVDSCMSVIIRFSRLARNSPWMHSVHFSVAVRAHRCVVGFALGRDASCVHRDPLQGRRMLLWAAVARRTSDFISGLGRWNDGLAAVSGGRAFISLCAFDSMASWYGCHTFLKFVITTAVRARASCLGSFVFVCAARKLCRCAGARPAIRSCDAISVLSWSLTSIGCFFSSRMFMGGVRRWWWSGRGNMSQFWRARRGEICFFISFSEDIGSTVGASRVVVWDSSPWWRYRNIRSIPPPRMLFCTTDLRWGIECWRSLEMRLALSFWKIMNETCSFGHVSASLVIV